MNQNINIMDVTLRDGSYAINFQFSDFDTKVIGKGLKDAGISYIEIGHGMGMRASSLENGLAFSTDIEYYQAMQKLGNSAKYGMFCIPDIAELADIHTAVKYGSSFIRVGTDINSIEKSEPYIKLAKELGLEVMANYMKSYVATEDEFAKAVILSKQYGADVIYIVDSAGCMHPDDLKKYYKVIKNNTDLGVGFHGHDNLGLAVANTLYAIELGFDFVDTSLQGLGRGAGNASTELVVANLLNKYKDEQYDCKKLISLGEEYIQNIKTHNGINGLDVYCGIAGFHSSYMKYIHKYVAKYSVNPYDLIYEYCQHDRVNMDEKVLENIAQQLKKEKINLSTYGFKDYIGDEQSSKVGRK